MCGAWGTGHGAFVDVGKVQPSLVAPRATRGAAGCPGCAGTEVAAQSAWLRAQRAMRHRAAYTFRPCVSMWLSGFVLLHTRTTHHAAKRAQL